MVAVKAIVLYKGKALVIKREEHDEIGAGIWEFAGGKLEFGEGLEDSLLREIKEETGLDAKVESLLYASTFFTDPARQVVILGYKCSVFNDSVVLSEEHSEYKWVTEQELRALLAPGIIKDLDNNGVTQVLW